MTVRWTKVKTSGSVYCLLLETHKDDLTVFESFSDPDGSMRGGTTGGDGDCLGPQGCGLRPVRGADNVGHFSHRPPISRHTSVEIRNTNTGYASLRRTTMTDVAEKQHEMCPDYLQIGDPVKDSPVGPGVITGITDAGYPQVNHVAVATLIREDGAVFNPHGFDMEKVVAQWREIDKKKAERG